MAMFKEVEVRKTLSWEGEKRVVEEDQKAGKERSGWTTSRDDSTIVAR